MRLICYDDRGERKSLSCNECRNKSKTVSERRVRMVERIRKVLQGSRRVEEMSEEVKKCPIVTGDYWSDCIESKCMAWREINHNDWDCVLLRNKCQ